MPVKCVVIGILQQQSPKILLCKTWPGVNSAKWPVKQKDRKVAVTCIIHNLMFKHSYRLIAELTLTVIMTGSCLSNPPLYMVRYLWVMPIISQPNWLWSLLPIHLTAVYVQLIIVSNSYSIPIIQLSCSWNKEQFIPWNGTLYYPKQLQSVALKLTCSLNDTIYHPYQSLTDCTPYKSLLLLLNIIMYVSVLEGFTAVAFTSRSQVTTIMQNLYTNFCFLRFGWKCVICYIKLGLTNAGSKWQKRH